MEIKGYKDFYKQDKLSIYNMDNMELMKQIPDKYFDIAIVDPPYGIGEDGSKTKKRENLNKIDPRNGRTMKIFAKNYKIGNWDNKTPEQNYFDELFRISKKIIIWGENYMSFNQKNSSSGRIFWNKVNGNNDFSDGEIAWTNLFKSTRNFDFMWAGMFQAKSILDGRMQQGNKKLNETRIHPTQKPIGLYKWLFLNFAKKGMKVFDSNLGSGTHAIASYYVEMDLDFTACELDSDYFYDSVKYIKENTRQLSLLNLERV